MLTLISLITILQPEPTSLPLSGYQPQPLSTFTLLLHPDAPTNDLRYRRTIAALSFDFDNINRLIPPDALTALTSVRIVITPETPARKDFKGRGMCYHESAGWLTANGYDAAREGTVEILNMDDFLTWRAEQPMMLLHELAHAYHHMIGFDNPEIQRAYDAAKSSHKYESVHFILIAPDKTKPAYAMNNQKEYFAELTEAWFGRNDYEPFTHDALLTFDPQGATAIDHAWHLTAEEIDIAKSSHTRPSP